MSERNHNESYWGSRSLSATNAAAPQGDARGGLPADSAFGPSQQPPSHEAGGWGGAHRRDAAGQVPYGQRPAPGQPYVYRSGKDHVVAGLLAIFLGGLGIHKFYLGYNSVGFLMLAVTILGSIFTLGLAGVVMELIGFIEGIIYLSKDQRSFDSIYVYNMKEWF